MDTIAEKGEPPKLESSVQKTNVIKSLRLSEIKEADDERVEISDEKPSKRSLISYIPHWITFANVIYSGCVILYIVTFIFSLVAYRQNYSKCVDYQMLQRDIYNFPYEYPCSSFLKQCIFNTPTDPGTGVGFVLLDNWANSTRACSKYSYKNCTTHKVNLEDFFYDQCC